jgi:hypothetical protein
MITKKLEQGLQSYSKTSLRSVVAVRSDKEYSVNSYLSALATVRSRKQESYVFLIR